MARITMISIEGGTEEIREALQRFLELTTGDHTKQTEQSKEAVSEYAQGRHPAEQTQWTGEELARLWRNELAEGTRAVLAEIATRPEGYPVAEVAQNMGLPPRHVGGRLSSMGFALKRAFPGKSDPIIRDRRTAKYKMEPEVATIFRELAQADGKPAGDGHS
jgi:hypothetical protein